MTDNIFSIVQLSQKIKLQTYHDARVNIRKRGSIIMSTAQTKRNKKMTKAETSRKSNILSITKLIVLFGEARKIFSCL